MVVDSIPCEWKIKTILLFSDVQISRLKTQAHTTAVMLCSEAWAPVSLYCRKSEREDNWKSTAKTPKPSNNNSGAKEEMKRGLIFGTDSAGRAAALNVIILTDCWQVVRYPRCTEDEAKPRTDRKCSWGGWRMLGGVTSKGKLNWVVIVVYAKADSFVAMCAF